MKGDKHAPASMSRHKKKKAQEEVAVHMCLYVTVLLCSIKMLVKQGAFVFMWIDSHPVHFKLYYS